MAMEAEATAPGVRTLSRMATEIPTTMVGTVRNVGKTSVAHGAAVRPAGRLQIEAMLTPPMPTGIAVPVGSDVPTPVRR